MTDIQSNEKQTGCLRELLDYPLFYVRASDQCVDGHGFDSCRGLRFVLCPTLVTKLKQI